VAKEELGSFVSTGGVTWRVEWTPELNRHILRYLERRFVVKTIVETPIRGNAARYTATVSKPHSDHLTPLLRCNSLVDPIWLIPMLFGDLTKMYRPRNDIRHATVGVPGAPCQSVRTAWTVTQRKGTARGRGDSARTA
jgi:hypothetical protein